MMHTQLVCRAVALSHQADWRKKRPGRKRVDDDGEEFTFDLMLLFLYLYSTLILPYIFPLKKWHSEIIFILSILYCYIP